MDEKQLAKVFLQTQRYDWREEFRHAAIYRGTRMPLSAIAKNLRIRYSWRQIIPGKYLTKSVPTLHIEVFYNLHPAGREVYRIQKQEFNLERSRFGSLSCWQFRANERDRQIARLQHWKKLDRKGELPLTELRHRFLEWFESERLPEWEKLFHNLVDTIDDNIRQGSHHVYELFKEYRSAQNKRSSYVRGVSWRQIDEPMAFKGAKAVKDVLQLILKRGIWSEYSPNPDAFLPAIRNRPLDSVYQSGQSHPMMVTEAHAIGDMWRSRGAMGLIPLSHVWAYAFNRKDEFTEEWMEGLFSGEKVYNPITDPLFYYHYSKLDRDGWYMFGDNIANVREGKVTIRDISMSEVLQGLLRQDKDGRCFSWFPWLDESTRQGPSGDPFTMNWNAEGIKGFKVILEDDPGMFLDDTIGLVDVIEDSDAFLGMAFSGSGRLMNKGLKLTVDSADKRIPVYFKPRGWNNLEWHPERVDLARALQNVVAYGLCEELDLAWFYERLKPVDEWMGDYFTEYPSASERIEEGFKVPGVLDEALEIISEERLLELWPHLEIDFMRKKIHKENE